MRTNHLAEGVVHTAVESNSVMTKCVFFARLHIYTCSKRRGTINGCTYTTLHVDG